jgi:GTP-binding protein HflX
MNSAGARERSWSIRIGGSSRDADARLEETAGLAAAIGVDVVERVPLRIRAPKPGTLIGSGQVEALAETVRDRELTLAVFDANLTPVQQRNLETGLGCKVIDRTGLILEIFGERARTAEGRLQVELAHLDYQAGRLVRSWTHLERQRGGFGFLGGPGETQIEADRRLIRDRMARLRRELDSGQPHPQPPPRPAPARALAGDRAGRLYQRRKVHAFQSPDGK